MWSLIKSSYNPVLFEVLSKSENPLETAHNIFQDTLIPQVGNLYAFNKVKDQEAVHVRADINDLYEINMAYSFDVGDDVLKMFGQLASEKAAEYVGQAFRPGGDEFHFIFKNTGDAHSFCRQLRAELEKLPPIEGTHLLSASFGIGANPAQAIEAMRRAKESLKFPTGEKKYETGQSVSVFYSLYPFEE